MKNRFYKILSIILSVAMIFSVCSVVASATDTTGNNYYVMYGGTGDGKSADSPVATVADAIALINADGLDADDTANIYVMQNESWTTSAGEGEEWHLTSWAANNDVPESHTATIVVQGYGDVTDSYGNIYLAFHNLVYKGGNMMIMGPTVFKNIRIVSNYSEWNTISLNGNNVTFGEGTAYHRHDSKTFSGGWSNGDLNIGKTFPGFQTTLGDHGASETYSEPINIVFENINNVTSKSKNRMFYLGGAPSDNSAGSRTHTFAEDVTITVNNSSTKNYFHWGNWSSGGAVTFGKNLNFNIISAAAIGHSTTDTPVAVNGGIQILLNSADSWITDISTFSNVNAAGGIFKLLNKTGVTDILEFTATAGVYKIKDGYTVAAYDADGKEYPCANGYLTVPAGEYTIKDYTPPVTNDYYVISGGTGNGKTVDTPAGSVAEAIATVKADNLSEGDTANIWIMQREDWNSADSFNMTYWNVNGGTTESHEADIVVQSYDTTTTTYLAATDTLGKGSITLTGPTTFKNITIVNTRSYYDGIIANGNNVTYGAGTKYATVNTGFSGTVGSVTGLYTVTGSNSGKPSYPSAQTIVYENEYLPGNTADRMLWIGCKGASTITYSEDVTIIFNNAKAEPRIKWGNTHNTGAGGTTFAKNLNINVKSANKVYNLDGNSAVTVTGGLQIINSGAAWDGDITSFTTDANGLGVVSYGGYWYLNNTTGLATLVDFTATAGTFSVREGYSVTATNDATGATKDSADGYLVLDAGSYTLTAEKLPETVNYYVKNGGTGDGRTSENPAATVYDAIVSVNEDGLIAGDTAIINIMQRTDWNASAGAQASNSLGTPDHEMTSWTKAGGNVPAHTATIVVQAYNTALDTYLVFSQRLGANDAMGMGGPTIFKNIRIVSNRGIYNAMWLNGKDVTFGEGTKYGTLEIIGTSDSTGTWDGTVKSQTSLAMHAVSYGDSPTIEKDVTYTFENEYISKNNNTNHAVRFTGTNGNVIYNNDVNFVLNNESAAVQMYFGNGNSGSTTVNGNLNIVVRSGNGWTMAEGKAPVHINGNIQMILNKGSAYSGGNITEYSNVTMSETSKYWFVKVSTNLADALSLTETDGTYQVIDGYVAVATNDATGVQTLSADGLLALDPGEYTVEVVEDYTNDGQTIRVYKDSTLIDLDGLYHKVIDGKLFIGWAKADGSWAVRKTKYSAGDVLTAQYIDFDSSKFAVEETHIRTEGDLGLRFIVNYDKEAVASIPNIQKYGTISLPLELSKGRELFLDTPVVLEWTWDTSDMNNFIPKTTGETPVEVVASNILEESATNLKYTLCMTNIEADKYNMSYAVRGYIYFKNYNGIYDVVYTETEQSSLYKEAAEAIAAGDEKAVYSDIVNYVEGTWTENYLANDAAISEYLAGVSTTTDTNPNHLMYRLNNGLIVRDVTVNSGINSDPIEIAFMADSHFNYVNEYDIATRSINALSSYRGRTWLRDGSSVVRSITAMKYASTFDKTIIGGDAIDYLSWGSQKVVENIFAKQSVNNSVLMAIGNHEIAETMQADISGLDDVMTLVERYNRIQKSWTNDVYYHEEIVNDKIMTIVLDNGNGDYWDSQIEPLKASIAKAREKGLKILIFQHIPMLTWNPNETCVYGRDGIDINRFGSSTDYSFTVDMTSYHGYMGGASCDAAATLEICEIIRKNYDVIAGVFNGHEHANLYTEIVALDENGNVLYDENNNMVVIPQHTVAGVHYGAMMKITIK